MTLQTTRRALIGCAGLAGVAIVAPAVAIVHPATIASANPDRDRWDAAMRLLKDAQTSDAALNARHAAAEAAGTLTEALDDEWDASATSLSELSWRLFDTPAPDIAAVEWKITMLRDCCLAFDADIAARVLADLHRISREA